VTACGGMRWLAAVAMLVIVQDVRHTAGAYSTVHTPRLANCLTLLQPRHFCDHLQRSQSESSAGRAECHLVSR
jgi:hypothetical protein